MDFCITAVELRKALTDIEAAEKNGFKCCLAIFKMASVSPELDGCRAEYSDMIEQASWTDSRLKWGRLQRITERNKFKNGKLVKIRAQGPDNY